MITEQCAILIGGMGTRLGALTRETPKPLLPVDGAPFLDVLIGEAVRRGFCDILLLAGYKSDVVSEYAAAASGRVLPAITGSRFRSSRSLWGPVVPCGMLGSTWRTASSC